MSAPAMGDLFTFWRAELEALQRTDQPDPTIWDDHAFLVRYGTADDLLGHAMQAEGLLAWWQARGGPLRPDGDGEAIRGLRAAADRLSDLHGRAVQVEARIRARGYEWDPESRTLKEARGTRGRRPSLLAQGIELAFQWLTAEQGFPEGNTVELREAIRDCLSRTFHPDLLLTDRGNPIHSRVNKLVNY